MLFLRLFSFAIFDSNIDLFDTSGTIIWELTYQDPNVFSYRAVTGAVDLPLIRSESVVKEAEVEYYYLLGPQAGEIAKLPLPKITILVKIQKGGHYLGKVILK